MFPTMEVRWFYKGTVSPEASQWFQQGERRPEEQPPRVDYYLCLSDRDSLGIKLREGRIEVKRRHRQHGVVRLGERVTGLVEHWRKWSFELAEGSRNLASIVVPPASWIVVKKERKLRRYRLAEDQKIVAVPVGEYNIRGCNLELTSISVKGKEWWSLSFEAFGVETAVYGSLVHVAQRLLATGESPILDAQDSYGYPKWLQMLGHRTGK